MFKGENSVFAFHPQTTYVYHLEASTENVLASSTGPNGKLHLTATAELQAVSPCQFGLSISQVQVVGANGKKHASLSALEGKPVQLGLQNGRLVPELCVDAEDTINTINLKRAVASLLQVTSTSKQQDTQAAPFLAASVKTQQRVKAGILEAATSHEEYDYRPFSNQGSGAVVSVHTSLTLQSQRAQINFRAPGNSKVESVIFEPPHSSGTGNVKVENIRSLVNDVGQAMINGVNANVPNMMHRLVRAIRQTSRDDLLNAFSQVKHISKTHKKVILDHLMLAGTGESIEVLAELIKRKEFDENPAVFYTKLAFVRHATLASVRSVKTLLETPNPSRELVLGAGSLAGSYLTQHAHEHEKDIDDIILEIAKGLGNNCNAKTHEQENKILTALKGIHNAHCIPDTVADKLKECATNKKASLRVRSAVLDSIQGDAANKKLQQVAYDILGDINEDSELRIKAYLVLVTCPCGNVATFVKNLLEKELVNQVGSFIVSHIRNLRASNNPEKEEAKKHLANIPLPASKFPFDVRKFSSNSELSYLFGQVNAAASAETNVIFSQKSFLPRFTSLNLTTQLFGHSFNLLEVGLRAENLEQILESYFGPRGYFKSHEADDMYKSGVGKATELANKIKERANKAFRSRRSIAKADVDKMAAKVQIQKDVDNINLDLYLKLFGAELAFFTYYGDPSTLSPSALVDKIFDGVDNIIKDAKNYNYELKQNLLLFDSELVYPTATGFPLRLIASSTAALRLNLGGNFDIHQLSKDPKNAQMRFNVQPSAAVEVVGNMELDFYAASSGLKHTVTLHTSTGVDMTLQILNGKGFDLNVGTPLSKQEIVTAKSELFATSRDGAQETDTPLQFNNQRYLFLSFQILLI
ncbi:hypothetical protein B566_EDAN008275 [Ephemera danica]|nr:hypothetical protein B566_EDAN008275 [Ephemera danica]